MGLLPQLTGTYDVLCIPLVLPRSTVEALLPTQWRHASPSLLLKTPDELNQLAGESGLEERKEGEEPHLVLLQLGHQKGTGPGPFKMTFQEAKLEIPFVRHPKLPEDSQKAFLFKQKCLFSNPMIYSGSQYMTGLNSAVGSFTPSDSPWGSAADAPTIEYTTKGYFEVTAQLNDSQSSTTASADAGKFLALAELPFFGDKTGDTITQFDFEEATVGPTAYTASGTLHLGAFSQDAEPKEYEFKSAVAWRSRNAFKATETKLSATTS